MNEKEKTILDKIASNVKDIKQAKDERSIIQLYGNIRILAYSGLEMHR